MCRYKCYYFLRVNEEFEEKNFDEILKEIRGFLYGNVCDVYVEYIKRDLQVKLEI